MTLSSSNSGQLLLTIKWLSFELIHDQNHSSLKLVSPLFHQAGVLSTGDSFDMCERDQALAEANNATLVDMEVNIFVNIFSSYYGLSSIEWHPSTRHALLFLSELTVELWLENWCDCGSNKHFRFWWKYYRYFEFLHRVIYGLCGS